MSIASRIVLLCFLAFGITGCNKAEEATEAQTNLAKEESPAELSPTAEGRASEEDPFPQILPLEFKPVPLSDLVEQEAEYNWEHLKTLQFGTFDGSPAFLHVYREAESSSDWDLLHGVFEISEKRYLIPAELSNSLLEEENEFNRDRLRVLQYDFPAADGPFHILGAIELFANGPGKMTYLLFEREEGKWKGFEEWGIPYVHDLDGDNLEELIVEFPGLHLSPPNVALFTYSEGKHLETAWVVTEKLTNARHVYATLGRDANPWLIHIGDEDGGAYKYGYRDRDEDGGAYKYGYRDKKLIRK